MRISESRLRRIIRSVLNENSAKDATPKELLDDLKQYCKSERLLGNDLAYLTHPSHLFYIFKHVLSSDQVEDYCETIKGSRLEKPMEEILSGIESGKGGKVTTTTSRSNGQMYKSSRYSD